MQNEWDQKGYCSENCIKTDEDLIKCSKCETIKMYNHQNDEYICPKCDKKIQKLGFK